MKTTFMLIFAALLLVGSGCTKSQNAKNAGDTYIKKDPQSGDGFMLFTEKTRFEELSETPNEGQPYKIDGVTREGNTLIISVSYSASCSVPTFDIVWDGRVMLSYPYKIDLVMKMNADNCSDKGQQTNSQIKIDLQKYVGDMATDKNTVFSVINASTKANTIYPTQHN